MKIYHYSKDTYEYIGESQARPNPLEQGEYLIPAFSTDIEPIESGENEVAIFDETAQNWTIESDYRVQIFYDADRNKYEITEIGVEPDPAWLTEDPRPSEIELKKQEISLWKSKLDEWQKYWLNMKFVNNATQEEIDQLQLEGQSIMDYIRTLRSELETLQN